LEGSEVEAHFQRHIVNCWIPRSVDKAQGGFRQQHAYDWAELPETHRTTVFQARLTWLAALSGHKEFAEHGVRYLQSFLWDQQYGGYFWSRNLDGSPLQSEKHSYAQAFAIYALSVARKEKEATQAFDWLEENAYDVIFGGYHDELNQQGKPFGPEKQGTNMIGTCNGHKSMNAHLHILEAFIELYKLTGKMKVKRRLLEVFQILSQRFVNDKGQLIYEVEQDWQVSSDIDSYGHALETAFLLVEAAELLEERVDETWVLAKLMVDYCLAVSWDSRHGGFFYEGHFGKEPHLKHKEWWTQAEGFNVLRLFAEHFGEPYLTYRKATWQFINDHQIDHEHGGWIRRVNEDGSSDKVQPKSNDWTESYHQARAVYLAYRR
jgi:cellobiose epimerase